MKYYKRFEDKYEYRKDWTGSGFTANGIKKMAAAMNIAAQNCVKYSYKKIILLQQDLDSIQKCLQANEAYFDFAYTPVWQCLESECKKKGYASYNFNTEECHMICDSIEEYGDCALDFEVMRQLTEWYGIKREKAVVIKDYIPEDDRTPLSNYYDGPNQVWSDQLFVPVDIRGERVES